MMKHKIGSITHRAILDFLAGQDEPVTIGKIAGAFGVSRNAVLVRMATLTFANPRIAEDEKGRVYLKKMKAKL
jgi:predicted ArsR family transcriptional regulator